LIGGLVAVLLLAVIGAGLYLVHANRSNPGAQTSTTPTVGVTPTATPTPAEVVTYTNTLIGKAPNWNNDTHCFPKSDGYHVQPGYFCTAPVGSLTDGRITVQAEATSGPTTDLYGIVLRASQASATSANYYFFGIDAAGEWAFGNCTSSGCTPIEDFTHNSAIRPGLKVFNLIAVDARGSHFVFYVNGQQVGETDDTTYTSGQLGLASGQTVAVVFRDITVAQPQ